MGDEEEEGPCEQKGPSGEVGLGGGTCQGLCPFTSGGWELSPVVLGALSFPPGLVEIRSAQGSILHLLLCSVPAPQSGGFICLPCFRPPV